MADESHSHSHEQLAEQHGEAAELDLSQSVSLHDLQSSVQLPLRDLDAAVLADIQRAYPQLTDLNLESNELRFSSLTPLLSSYLPSLRSINVSFNHLERLPDMGALPHLTALNLQGNSIAHVEHLARCPLLQSLDLSINRVDSLPSLCSELIMECPQLTSLSLQQNPLSPQVYRVALISLLTSLRSLDGAVVRPEEKAYLQLLAATQQINESREGQESEAQAQQRTHHQQQQRHHSAFSQQSQWAHTVAAGMAPSLAQLEHGDDLHVQDVDEEDEHDQHEQHEQHSSPLQISAASSSDESGSPPSSNSSALAPGAQRTVLQQRHAESLALASAAAAAVQQRQERNQREHDDMQAQLDAQYIRPVEPQHSSSLYPSATGASAATHAVSSSSAPAHAQRAPQSEWVRHASRAHGVEPFSPEDAAAAPALDGAHPPPSLPPSVLPTPSASAVVSRASSPLHFSPPAPDAAQSTQPAPSNFAPPAHAAQPAVGQSQQFQPQSQQQFQPQPQQQTQQQQPQQQQQFSQPWHQPSPSQQHAQQFYPQQQHHAAPLAAQAHPASHWAPLQSWPAEQVHPGHAAHALPNAPVAPSMSLPPPAALPAMAPAAAAPVAAAAPPAPAAPSAAIAAALNEQAQLVQSLKKELQESRDSLAREQALVRTVKAYYQTTDQPPKNARAIVAPPAHMQPQSASSTNPFSLPHFPASSSSDSTAASAAAGVADTLRAEVLHLRKQNVLLQVQNDAAQEIMRIRDRQAEEQHMAMRQGKLPAGGAGAGAGADLSLLWRDKVFALLVQNKSLLLTHAGDIRGYKQELLAKSQTVTQLEQQLQLLGKSNASLQSQLQLLHNDSSHRQRAQEQAHQMQSAAQASVQRTQRDVDCIRHVLGVFHEQACKMEEQARAAMESRLRALNGRLGFAQQRVEVVRAMRLARRGCASSSAGDSAGSDALPRLSSGPIPLIPLPESKEADEADQAGDPALQHLRKEIDRLQKDRSLIYSSWQCEASSLRAEVHAQSARASSAEVGAKSLQNELKALRVEADYLASQNEQLRKESAGKVAQETLAQLRLEHERKLEQLGAELSVVSEQFSSLKRSADQEHKALLRCQVELQHARHALGQAKSDAEETSRAREAILAEKLRRREVEAEQLASEKRQLAQRIREMDQQIILLRHGLVAPGAGMAGSGNNAMPMQLQMGLPAHTVPAPVASAAPPNAMAGPLRTASASSFSNLLFGNTQAPVISYPNGSVAASSGLSYVPHARPPPVQPQWQMAAPPAAAALSSTQALPTSTSSLLHDHPIPASFGQSAAALEQQLSASVSAASSRAQSRVASVAPSPMRPSRLTDNAPSHEYAPVASAAPAAAAPTAPIVPPLRFPPSTPQSMGVSSPPLASAAAPPLAPSSSRPPSAEVSRKLSHLAALSARLLDDD